MCTILYVCHFQARDRQRGWSSVHIKEEIEFAELRIFPATTFCPYENYSTVCDLLAAEWSSRYSIALSAGASWGMWALLYGEWGFRWRYDKLIAADPLLSDQLQEKCKALQRYVRKKHGKTSGKDFESTHLYLGIRRKNLIPLEDYFLSIREVGPFYIQRVG